MLKFVIANTVIVKAAKLHQPVCDDPDDDKIFVCALSAGCKTIISVGNASTEGIRFSRDQCAQTAGICGTISAGMSPGTSLLHLNRATETLQTNAFCIAAFIPLYYHAFKAHPKDYQRKKYFIRLPKNETSR